ncbi:MAG: hypothetical protein LBS96_04400 [Oscillospiraceae bacterium]|jgi:hypothetical protein|nr:hypothetical protein [Oscillospiraceae bacterium]
MKQKTKAKAKAKTIAIVVFVVVVCGVGSALLFSWMFKALQGNEAPASAAAPGGAAVTVGGAAIGAPEWAFYFFNAYVQEVQTAQQLAAYGMTGWDSTKSPFGQSRKNADGTTQPMEEYLRGETNKYALQVLALCDEAEKTGVQIQASKRQEIEQNMQQLQAAARSSGISLEESLRKQYAEGVTEAVMRTVLERSYLSEALRLQKAAELGEEGYAAYVAAAAQARKLQENDAQINAAMALANEMCGKYLDYINAQK